MRNFFVFLIAFFAISCLAATLVRPKSPLQTGASASPQKPARHSMPGGERKMRGCLLKEDSGFILQNTRGRKVKLDTAADLSSDVNHEVRIHGTFVDATPDTPAPGNSHSAPPDDPADREFHVVKIDTLAQSCTQSQPVKKHRP